VASFRYSTTLETIRHSCLNSFADKTLRACYHYTIATQLRACGIRTPLRELHWGQGPSSRPSNPSFLISSTTFFGFPKFGARGVNRTRVSLFCRQPAFHLPTRAKNLLSVHNSETMDYASPICFISDALHVQSFNCAALSSISANLMLERDAFSEGHRPCRDSLRRTRRDMLNRFSRIPFKSW
jgi:hypothetical protein